MVRNFMQLRRSFRPLSQSQKGLSTHVYGIHGTRATQFVGRGRLQNFDRFVRVATHLARPDVSG